MYKIIINALSVNKAYTWTRKRSKEYNKWKTVMKYELIPFITENEIDFWKPKLKLWLNVEFWYKTEASDIDNWLKSFIDALQFGCWFNDNKIYELNVKKKIVDEPYIKFNLYEI